MSEPTSLILERKFGEHNTVTLFTEQEGVVTVMVRCNDCNKHRHETEMLWDEESQLMLMAEMQMHGAGVDDGWHDGLGFMLEGD